MKAIKARSPVSSAPTSPQLITAVILYAVGTGSIKGFAITTAIGVATSMFTAIVGARAIVNLLYGGKRINKLSI